MILPAVNQGRTVRFARRPAEFKKLEGEWPKPRAVYLQNPSDPIVWCSPSLLLSKPDWLSEELGEDVNKTMIWMPLVTFVQVSADYLAAKGPNGHGHRYGHLTVDAWAQIAAPDAWTEEDTQRLKMILD